MSGKSIRGVLNYNENKIANAEASLIMAAGFPRDPGQLSFKSKLQRFEQLTALNERTKTNALHVTLNFSNRDKLDDELLQIIALHYMQGIGFGDQPFLVYRHFDAAHTHIHIATVNIDSQGRRIETHNIGKNQSEKIRKEIEIKYGLVKAEDQKSEEQYMLRPVELEQVIYGKRETKAAISAIVREVADTYKFTSLSELNALLRQFNVLAWPGAEGTMMHEKGGLVYCILDTNGSPVGIPIKASSIYSSPTLKNLQKTFLSSKTERKPFGVRIKHLLERAFSSSKDTTEFTARLKAQGIRVLIRENEAGQVYGVSIIDNATRCIFNGSDLGKPYAAKAFMERFDSLPLPDEKNNVEKADAQAIELSIHSSGGTLPVIERVRTVHTDGREDSDSSDPYSRKKQRKIRPD